MTAPHPMTPEEYAEVVRDAEITVAELGARKYIIGPIGQRQLRDARALLHTRAMALEEANAVISDWLKPSVLKLRAGEMTAQETRTVRAVLSGVRRCVRNLTSTEGE